jgi:hypothetical protein
MSSMTHAATRLAQPPRGRRGAAGRPFGVGVVATIDAIMGGLSILGGLGSLAVTSLPAPAGLGFLQFLEPVLPESMLGIGAIQLVMAYGLWRGLPWAWTLAVVFETIHVLADIGFVADRSFTLDKLVGLVIIVGSLAYLLRPSVRAFFGRAQAPARQANLPA